MKNPIQEKPRNEGTGQSISDKANGNDAESPNETSSDLELVPGTAADVNNEDLQALRPKDLTIDLGDDKLLKNKVYPIDFGGADLDISEVELDDENEKIGWEDEENNNYNLGDNMGYRDY
jgi:hypothetical protein